MITKNKIINTSKTSVLLSDRCSDKLKQSFLSHSVSFPQMLYFVLQRIIRFSGLFRERDRKRLPNLTP